MIHLGRKLLFLHLRWSRCLACQCADKYLKNLSCAKLLGPGQQLPMIHCKWDETKWVDDTKSQLHDCQLSCFINLWPSVAFCALKKMHPSGAFWVWDILRLNSGLCRRDFSRSLVPAKASTGTSCDVLMFWCFPRKHVQGWTRMKQFPKTKIREF